MAVGPIRKPQRIPPSGGGTALAPPPPRPMPPPPPVSVATDAFALQAQLDRLVTQFEEMRGQLRQAQKLASIGTTAAMIAHEFNNLLTPVVAYARQAVDTQDPALMHTALTKTLERADILRGMADRMIGLARQSDTAIKVVKVRAVVENAIACLGRDLGKDNIAVQIQIDPELTLRANENQLLQVLFNLVINGRQAMLGRRGRLSIDAAPTSSRAVEINVRDTGCGIPPENLERIFEPFFTTKRSSDKPSERGLGLGLYICRDICAELGGRITVESKVNVGTTFTIALPAAD